MHWQLVPFPPEGLGKGLPARAYFPQNVGNGSEGESGQPWRMKTGLWG